MGAKGKNDKRFLESIELVNGFNPNISIFGEPIGTIFKRRRGTMGFPKGIYWPIFDDLVKSPNRPIFVIPRDRSEIWNPVISNTYGCRIKSGMTLRRLFPISSMLAILHKTPVRLSRRPRGVRSEAGQLFELVRPR